MKKLSRRGFVIALLMLSLAASGMTYNIYRAHTAARTIAVSYMTMNNPFYSVINSEIQKEVERRQDRLITLDPLLSVKRQQEQIARMVADGVDGLIVNPIDSASLSTLLQEARTAGIPVVIVDSPVSGSDLVQSTITSNNYQAGVLCAQNLLESKKQASILLLEHTQAASACERIAGFLDTLESHPEYRIVQRIDCQGQLETAMPLCVDAFEAHPEIDVVMALNDPSALGAMAAAQSTGHTQVMIYGVDGTPDVKQQLLQPDSLIKATAAQSPSQLGRLAIETMYAILTHQPYEKEIVVGVELVDAGNVQDYKPDGWS